MSTQPATDSLAGYIPAPVAPAGRQMVGITTADHERISTLAKEFKTSNGKIVTALLDFYFDDE